MSAKPKVLIVTDWYVPGYKAGGPITSVYKMVKQLGTEIDFSIITRNHDWHDPEPFSLPSGLWLEGEGSRVKYLADHSASSVWSEIQKTECDVLYFNGIYAPAFHALPILRLILRHRGVKIIVAPRGMLNPNAIALKSFKKKVLLALYRIFGIENKVLFHSTGEKETRAIQEVFPRAQIKEVSNVPAVPQAGIDKAGSTGFLSVARISPVKNTVTLVELFKNYELSTLTLIGTADDKSYLEKCQGIMSSTGHILHIAGVRPDVIEEHYASARYFISMTTGENFGHAIIEALASGCPVIISDRTPWNDIESHGAGWVVPLENTTRWEDVLSEAASLDDEKYHEMSAKAVDYVKRKFDLEQLRKQYLELFGATN